MSRSTSTSAASSCLQLLMAVLVAQTSAKGSAPYFPKACVSLSQSRLPTPTYENAVLYGYVYLRVEVAGPYWCARRCLQQRKCKSFNFHVPSSTCQLNTARVGQDPGSLVVAKDFIHYDREHLPEYFLGACEGHSCHPESVCQPQDAHNYTCVCQDPNFSPNNCSAALPSDACSTSPCMNEGTCMTGDAGFHCMCPPGVTGERCQYHVCPDYNRTDRSPNSWTPEVELVWQNEAGSPVDMLWVHADGKEHFGFTIPAAAQRLWSARVEYVWVARERESRTLLPVDRDCSFVVPAMALNATPVITGN